MVSIYARALVHECYIIFRYSAIPGLLVLLLTYVSWNYATVLAVLKLVVFLRMIHNEDQRTATLHFRYIFVKIAIVVCIYYLTYAAVLHIQENYLPDIAYHVSSTFGTTKVTVPVSKAKSMMLKRNSTNFWSKAQYFLLRALLEYMEMCHAMSQFRLTYLSIIFVVYGAFQVIMWYYFPQKIARRANGSSTDSDSSVSEPASQLFVPEG